MTRSTQHNTTLLLKIYIEHILHIQHINPRLKNILPYREPDLKNHRTKTDSEDTFYKVAHKYKFLQPYL